MFLIHNNSKTCKPCFYYLLSKGLVCLEVEAEFFPANPPGLTAEAALCDKKQAEGTLEVCK